MLSSFTSQKVLQIVDCSNFILLFLFSDISNSFLIFQNLSMKDLNFPALQLIQLFYSFQLLPQLIELILVELCFQSFLLQFVILSSNLIADGAPLVLSVGRVCVLGCVLEVISGGLLEYCVDGFVYLFQLLASHSVIFKYYSLDFTAEDVMN